MPETDLTPRDIAVHNAAIELAQRVALAAAERLPLRWLTLTALAEEIEALKMPIKTGATPP